MKEGKSQLDIDHINSRDGSTFIRGMIIMYYGGISIPEGWAICDGNTYTYNGISTTTPNLINKFIKGTQSYYDCEEHLNPDLNENNQFILKTNHLPKHNHVYKEHTHEFSGIIENSGNLNIVLQNEYVSDLSKDEVYIKTGSITDKGIQDI
jgi:hypothetical protein